LKFRWFTFKVWLTSLELGQVSVDGVNIHLDHFDPMNRTINDSSVHGGEFSFGDYVIRMARGDREFVGIPIFPYRAFRHRCFFTLTKSDIQTLPDLEGKRIGTNAWATTSSTWNRALLREHNVRIDKSRWWVGSLDNPELVPQSSTFPSYVQPIDMGLTIEKMLISGELDALMCPRPPASFYRKDSPIIRVIADYRNKEREHFKRTGLYPADHIIVLRREIFNRQPELIYKIFRAFEKAKNLWLEQIRTLPYSNMTPWMLADIEEVTQVIDNDWQPFGISQNLRMIKTLCDESMSQGLIDNPLSAEAVFEEFEQVMNREVNFV
jgi:4,5-dihydroxyphthalate decarboxylase